MRSIAMLGALAVLAAPLSAQGNFRTGTADQTRRPSAGTVLGGVLGRDTTTRTRNESRNSDHIPPGQRPPAGMCRIWIDGVPPGQQPAPTDCQTAVATKPANARVIWGDQTAFPGKGKGKFKQGKGEKDERHGVRGRDHDDDDDDRDDDDRVERNRKETRGIGGVFGTSGKSVAKRGKKG